MSLSISLNPNAAALYWHTDNPYKNNIFNVKHEQVANNREANKDLSSKGRKRMRNAINWLTFLSAKRNVRRGKGKFIHNFNISFITLTLPAIQKHSHAVIKSKCLNHFLVIARRKWNVQNYVWKAEIQSNGNIHFHITTDKYIPYMHLRREWNNVISKLGYIKAYQSKFKHLTYPQYKAIRQPSNEQESKQCHKAYQYGKRTNWSNPNTTDVRKVKNVKNLAAYFSKYMSKPLSKNKQGDDTHNTNPFRGRIWFLSTSLSKLKSLILPFNPSNSALINTISKIKGTYSRFLQWVDLFYFNLKTFPRKLKEHIRQLLVAHAVNSGYPFPSSTLKAGL